MPTRDSSISVSDADSSALDPLGEYVATVGTQSLIMMGNLRPFQVRVNVDEEVIPRLKLNVPARAKIRGDVQQEEVPLSYVRMEPYVVPKTLLTGVNTERVDTRVVQVVSRSRGQSLPTMILSFV